MKLNKMLLSFLACTLSLACLSLNANAKEISLYDNPKTDAKVIGKVDLAAGIIPIFTPKTGDWVKIADPRNGNTGWVKSSDLNNSNGSTTVMFQQKINNNGDDTHTYQVIQYGKPSQMMTPQQSAEIARQMQIQRDAMQKTMQNIMKDMNIYQDQFNNMMKGNGFPMLMPIVVVPVQPVAQPASAVKPVQQNPVKQQK